MVDYYISPNGSGSKTGAGISNASTLSQLDKILAGAQPGDRILLIADKGDYNITKAITLTHGGTDAGAITIKGVSSSGADMAATFVSNRAETFSPTSYAGQEVFKLLSGADHLHFENMNFQDVNAAFRLGGKLEDISLQHMTADNINRFVYNLASGTATDATVSGLVIKDVDVTGFAKAVVSLRYDTNNVLIEDVNGDSQHIDGSNFATGVQLDGSVHAVVIKDTKMGNITDTVNKYWNGDGFATEENVYDIAFINTYAYNNTDGGYDLKSKSTTLINAVAEGNTRNFRFWANDTVLENVTGIDPKYHGGSSTTPSNVWLATNAKVTVKDSEFTDTTGKALLFDLKNSGAVLSIDNVVTNQTDVLDILKSGSSKLVGILGGLTGTPPVEKPVEEPVEKPVEPTPSKPQPQPQPEPGKPTIDGTTREDNLTGSNGDDAIRGKEGKDVLNGGKGNDNLDGGRHEDVLNGGEGADLIAGGMNADTINGGLGEDLVYGDISALIAGMTGGNDNVYGGDSNDVIFGEGAAMTGAQGGRDYVWGGNGNDILYGDARSLTAGAKGGNDVLRGDDGNDTLYGDGETSAASAGGNDKLYGDKGDDLLNGGGGNDTFVFEGKGFGRDVIADFSRSAGNQDMIDLSQMKVSFDDLDIKVVGGDSVITFAGGDTITVKGFTGLTKDHVVAAIKSQSTASADTGKAGSLFEGSDAADTLRGGADNDKLYGLAGHDRLYGGDGKDTLYGRQGNDTLYGDSGADNLIGDGGRDVLYGGRGDDVMSGGADVDLFVFGAGDGSDVISGFEARDLIGFKETGLKLSDLSIMAVAEGLLVHYGEDSILLKGLETVNTDQFIFG
jgi:serralysin